ncbi:MAG: hypothetical protein K2U26_10455 [Cyclobacteriaceae bacterium]|nr:hypothetical protein [Cyclobacteriaceae bacterium]
MDKENWLDALNDDLRDIRALTLEVRKETEAIREETKVLKEEVKETKRKADAAWELVVMTREQMREELAYLKKPLWKKWFGLN